jgi:hypothetical protein
MPYHRFKVG